MSVFNILLPNRSFKFVKISSYNSLSECFKEDPNPPFPSNSKQDGLVTHALYNGSKFQGFQKSQGNSYDVEVILQVHILFSHKFSRFVNKIILLVAYRFGKLFFMRLFEN